MPWGVAAAVGGALVSGSMASDASGEASEAQSQSSANSIAEQRRQYDLTRQDYEPYRKSGVAANKLLATYLGLPGFNVDAENEIRRAAGESYDRGYRLDNPGGGQYTKQQIMQGAVDNYREGLYGNDQDALSLFGIDTSTNPSDDKFGSLLRRFSKSDLESDPVYQSGLQFGLDQGTGAINARAIQGGSYDSGATLKALTRYANDYGSTKANESYNRYNTDQTNIYNRLAGLSGSGQTATNQVAAAGSNMANQVSNAYTDQGNARAAGIVGGANAWGDAISGIGQNAMNYNKYLKGLSSGGNTDWTTQGYGVDGAYSDY